MYRLQDVNCSHPLALPDLTLKPSAPTQSRWGYQAHGTWYSF